MVGEEHNALNWNNKFFDWIFSTSLDWSELYPRIPGPQKPFSPHDLLYSDNFEMETKSHFNN